MARTSRTRSPRSARGGRRSTNVVTGLDIFTAPDQHWFFRLLGLLVRARAELFIVAVLFAVYVAVQALAHSWGTPLPTDPTTGVSAGVDPLWGRDTTVIVMTVMGGVVLIVPASRRYLIDRLWCVTTRHRIRACLTHSRMRLMTRNGRMPFIIWSRPTPIGVRVKVWLPAGLAVKDLDHLAPEIAAACWAHNATVTQSRTQAALAIVDVIRRDPLASSRPLTPVLIDDLAHDHADAEHRVDAGNVVPLPDRRTITIPAVAPASTTGSTGTEGPIPRQRRTDKTSTTTATADTNDKPAVTGFGGMDVSDYI